MTTLSIKDLARNEELSGAAMTGVRGGSRALVDLDLFVKKTSIDKDINTQVANVFASQNNTALQSADVVNGSGNAVFGGKRGGILLAKSDVDQDIDQYNKIDVTQTNR
jgi:hypothetical protein